jgi:phosphomannomutase
VRVSFERGEKQLGWFLARKSNTEDILVMRIEAINRDSLKEIHSLVMQRVSPQIDISSLII